MDLLHLEHVRPRPARRRGRRRDRLLPERRRGPGRLHLTTESEGAQPWQSPDHPARRRPRAVVPDADREDGPGDQDDRVGRPDRGPRDRSRVRQGLRGLVRGRPATSSSSSHRTAASTASSSAGSEAPAMTTDHARAAVRARRPIRIARRRSPTSRLAGPGARDRATGRGPRSSSSSTGRGELDKVWPVLILSSTPPRAASDCKVFVTFWGLLPFVKDQKRIVGENWMQKMLTLMQRPGIDHLKLSKMNFLGMGPWMMGTPPQAVRRREPARAARGGHRPGRRVHPVPDDDGHVRPQARGPHRRDGRARRRRDRDRDHDRGRRLAVHLGRRHLP